MEPHFPFDLWQLEIFVKSVDFKSFSKAAEASYISQPTVSNHISQLEKIFNTRLFDRLGRQVVPTKAGVLLYKHAKKMLDLKQNLIEELQNFLGVIQGEFTFGASTTPGTYVLPRLMGKFKQEFSQVALQIFLGDTQDILEKILQGSLELGMVGYLPDHPLITSNEFVQDELVLVVPKGHPWQKRSEKSEIPFFDLFKENLIVREVGSGTRQLIEDVVKERGYKLAIDFNTSILGSTEAIKQAVLNGLGVSILSKRSVEMEIEHGYLFPIPIQEISFIRKFYYIYHSPRSLSPICKLMISFLERQKPDF